MKHFWCVGGGVHFRLWVCNIMCCSSGCWCCCCCFVVMAFSVCTDGFNGYFNYVNTRMPTPAVQNIQARHVGEKWMCCPPKTRTQHGLFWGKNEIGWKDEEEKRPKLFNWSVFHHPCGSLFSTKSLCSKERKREQTILMLFICLIEPLKRWGGTNASFSMSLLISLSLAARAQFKFRNDLLLILS